MKCGAHLARTIIVPRCRCSASASTASSSSIRVRRESPASPAPRPVGHQEVEVEADGALVRRPVDEAPGSRAALPGVAVVCTHEVEPAARAAGRAPRPCARARGGRRGRGRDAPPRASRRSPRRPRRRRPSASPTRGSVSIVPFVPTTTVAPRPEAYAAMRRQVVAHERLAAAQDQERRRVDREQLVDDPEALVGRELAARPTRTGRRRCSSACRPRLQRRVRFHATTCGRNWPVRRLLGAGEDTRRGRCPTASASPALRPLLLEAAPRPPASPRPASSSRSRPGTCPSSPRCRESGSASRPSAFASSMKARISGDERVLALGLGADLARPQLVEHRHHGLGVELVGLDHGLLVLVHDPRRDAPDARGRARSARPCCGRAAAR